MTSEGEAAAIGRNIKRYREDKGLTASELAKRAEISRSYLSELENGTGNHRRPSANVLYSLGKILGVTMSDLLGRPLIVSAQTDPPPSLEEFAKQENLARPDIEMLASIKFRGEAPSSPERWRFIYQAIRNSAGMDPR